MKVSEILKSERLKRGMPVPVACMRLGITERALRDYESGKRVPRDEIKEAYSFVFRMSVKDLFYPE